MCAPALRQRVAGRIEFVETALGRRRQLDESRLDGRAHRGEHARVDGVRLRPLPYGLGEPARAQGVHRASGSVSASAFSSARCHGPVDS